ncbi:MAG: FimV/HubP family polar landmark protein [Burkholderiales bacterium]|nr:FimV/HubP family polar landmark protein [Burkholderiales bacterium]
MAALTLAWGAHAAGLGRLTVHSALGQPLKAEIELLAVQRDELASLSVRLASAEAFRQARMERAEALSGLRFELDQRPNGQPIVRITSSAPINDPFLDLLIELSWNTGRLIREYTLLFDLPPDARPRAETPPVAPVVAERPAAQTGTAAAAPAPAKPAAPTRYGPVRPGETLQAIARKTRPADVTVEQMMVGIYHHNRAAFLGNNMNRLRQGTVLNLPDRDLALRVDPQRAAREVRQHASAWASYRSRLAEAVAQAPARAAPEAEAGRLVTAEPPKAPAPPAKTEDVLKLSKGAPASPQALERIQSLEEELAAKGRALQEAQERVAQLERTVKDLQRLLELKAAAPSASPAPAPAPEPPAPPAEAVPAAPAPAPQAAAVASKPPAQPATPKVAAPPPSPEDEGPSWLATFIANPLYVGGLVAAVLLSVLLWMMMVGLRRRKGLSNFEDSIMTGGEFKNEAVFTAGTGTAGAATGGSALLTDFSRLGLGAIDAHEVDPIAEAEVYMAYGRDSQAEEILKEALAKDPNRHELALKLLEIYAARKDTVAFEAQASELYASLGGQPTEVWLKAAEIGRSIDPDNPLYKPIPAALSMPAGRSDAAAAAAAGVAAAGAAAAEQGFGPAPETPPAGATPMDASIRDLGAAASATDNALDFDLGGQVAVAEDSMAAAGPSTPAASLSQRDEMPAIDFPQPAPAAPAETAPFSAASGQTDVGLEPQSPIGQTMTQTEPAVPEIDDLTVAEVEETQITLPTAAEARTPVEEVPEFQIEPEALQTGSASGLELSHEDLEAIDLDLKSEPVWEGEAGPVPAAGAEPSGPMPAAAPAAPGGGIDPELWEENNTKLGLARAYLEMGDKEGAREILLEVLREGDGAQQEDARRLLAEVG